MRPQMLMLSRESRLFAEVLPVLVDGEALVIESGHRRAHLLVIGELCKEISGPVRDSADGGDSA